MKTQIFKYLLKKDKIYISKKFSESQMGQMHRCHYAAQSSYIIEIIKY